MKNGGTRDPHPSCSAGVLSWSVKYVLSLFAFLLFRVGPMSSVIDDVMHDNVCVHGTWTG